MKKLPLLYLLMGCSFNLPAQDFQPDLSQWDISILRKAKVASFGLFTPNQTGQVIFYCNLARMDGALFAKTILKPYLLTKDATILYMPYVSSLFADLNRIPRLKPLQSSRLLSNMAMEYATSSGKAGIVGHKNFKQRFSSLYPYGWTVGENCAYHQENALDAVIDLLIDQDEPSLGHRHNILSPHFTWVGVGTAIHRDYENVWVIEFLGK